MYTFTYNAVKLEKIDINNKISVVSNYIAHFLIIKFGYVFLKSI